MISGTKLKVGAVISAVTVLMLTLSGAPTPALGQTTTATATTTTTATSTATGTATSTATATATATATGTATATATVPPGIGRIQSGNVPGNGFGLIVASGRIADIVVASGCPAATSAFWATINGDFVTYVPGTAISAVNEAFLRAFPNGVLPASTPLVGKCS